jgi:hypothetical protein
MIVLLIIFELLSSGVWDTLSALVPITMRTPCREGEKICGKNWWDSKESKGVTVKGPVREEMYCKNQAEQRGLRG